MSQDLQNTPQRAILFADIVDSTRLYQAIGDEAAQSLISEGVDLLKDIVEQYNGTFIKSIGDEIMSEFDTATEATEAAIFMIQMIANLEETEGEPWNHLHLKIGIHFGPVIEKDEDVFGNSVNIAARIVSQAKDSQILVTHSVIDHIDDGMETRFIDTVKLKGIKEETKIFEVLCSEENSQNTTAIMDADLFAEFQTPEKESIQELVLNYANNCIVVNYDYDRVKLGRHEDNEIVINSDGVSRIHAQIEYKRGKYYLVDQSINGTFVCEEEGKKIHLKRDEMILHGNGKISLGSPPKEDSPFVIHFKFET